MDLNPLSADLPKAETGQNGERVVIESLLERL
jgi:hypothetical protein